MIDHSCLIKLEKYYYIQSLYLQSPLDLAIGFRNLPYVMFRKPQSTSAALWADMYCRQNGAVTVSSLCSECDEKSSEQI
jgi:hypothetical protein